MVNDIRVETMLDDVFVINNITVFCAYNQLHTADGEIIEATPKSIQILQFLAASNGKVVTYQQLSDEIWGGNVSEGALYQQMTQLRRLLGDNPNQPKFIKTLPRQGYQFIAHVQNGPIDKLKTAPSKDNTSPKRNTAIIIMAASVLLAVLLLIITSTAESKNSPLKNISNLQVLEKLLTPAKKQFIYELTINNSPTVSQDNLALIESLAFFYIGSDKQSHIIKSKQNTGLLAKHFSHERSSYRPKETQTLTVKIHHNKASLLIKDGKIDIESPAISLTSNAQNIDKWLVDSLASFGIKTSFKSGISSDTATNLALLKSVDIKESHPRNRSDIEKSIRSATRAINLNPNSLFSYSLYFDKAAELLSLSGGFNLDQTLNQLARFSQKAKSLNPEYHKSYYASAEVHCNLLNNQACINDLKQATALNPHHSMTLSALAWNFDRFNLNTNNIHAFNYLYNPQTHETKLHYRNGLLKNGFISDASHLMNTNLNAFSCCSPPYNWAFNIQSDTNLYQLEALASHYRMDYSHSNKSLMAPSRYISYRLLDAQKPVLAKHWLKNGSGNNREYFELQLIQLLADSNQPSGNEKKWHQIRSLAEDRSQYQDPLDKFRLAFFDYHYNYLQAARDRLLLIQPELNKDELSINRNNFRHAVYYAETLKRLGDFKTAVSINKKLRSYLENSDDFSTRHTDIGIADVEFYTLNGDKDKAMKLLQVAVQQQGWLPNHYWLWLPLNKNPFLKSLHQREDFQKLQQQIDTKLSRLCFDSMCNHST